MRTIEEVLNCVNYCMFSKGCTKENYDCCYGDKGLSDCDVRLENDYKKIMAEVKKINTFDRLEEICNAERDGRLVVLPCKVGAKIYVTINYPVYFDEIEETVITGVAQFLNNDGTISNQINTSLGVCFLWDRDFNNEVFLTREEAEKALKERENNDR